MVDYVNQLDELLSKKDYDEIKAYFSDSDIEESQTFYHLFSFLRRNGYTDICSKFLDKHKNSQSENKKYIVIGTSPIALLKANFLASLGLQVKIIEGGSLIGGAWSVINTLDLNEIPRATHIIMPNRKSYDFLQTVFHVNLELSDPQPLEINCCKDGGINVFPNKSLAFENFPEYDGKPHQIIGGTRELVKKLLEQAESNKIKIIKNCTIKKIVKNDPGENLFDIYSSDNEIIKCDKIVLTNGTNIKSIVDKEHHFFTNDLYENISMHILVSNAKAKYGFVHFNDHPFIKEFQDISGYVTSENHSLFVLKMKYQFWREYPEALTLEKILNELIKFNIISGEFKIIDHSRSDYLNYRMSKNLTSYIKDNHMNDICLLPFIDNDSNDEYRWASQDLSIVMSTEKFYQALLWI